MNHKKKFVTLLSKCSPKQRDVIQTILEREMSLLTQEFKLTVQQINLLEEGILSIIVGLERSDFFVQTIGKRVGVSGETRKILIKSIDDRILKPIKKILMSKKDGIL